MSEQPKPPSTYRIVRINDDGSRYIVVTAMRLGDAKAILREFQSVFAPKQYVIEEDMGDG